MIRLIMEAEGNMKSDIEDYLEKLISEQFEYQLLNAVSQQVPGYDPSWGNQSTSEEYREARQAFLDATMKELFANFEI